MRLVGPERWGIGLLLLSLVLTALVAAALPGLAFQPGMPPPALEAGHIVLPEKTSPVGMGLGSFSAILGLIVFGTVVLVMVIRAARGVPWKRLMAGAWSLLWKLGLGAGVVVLAVFLLPKSGGDAPAEPPPTAPHPLTGPPLGPVPPALIWAAGIILGVAVVLPAVRLLLARRRAPARTWLEEAALARQALLEGRDVRAVILRCYTSMAEALQEERGIERKAFMTTGEFEMLLTEKGLPREPVRRLTRLFETARYSLKEPVTGEEKSAIACLDAILKHSRAMDGTP